jgi:hypothetical protein
VSKDIAHNRSNSREAGKEMRPESYQANENQIGSDEVVQQPRYQQNQDPEGQRDDRLNGNNIDIGNDGHDSAPFCVGGRYRVIVGDILDLAESPASTWNAAGTRWVRKLGLLPRGQ